MEYTRPATWEDVKTLARYLQEAGVQYALVGGYAIAAHGFNRHFVSPVYPVDHINKKVLSLQSTSDAVNCFFFRLMGVDEADPIKPGDKWFALPRSQLSPP